MPIKTNITFSILICFFCHVQIYCQDTSKEITLDEVVNFFSVESSAAQIEKLNFQNDLLQFENYKKSFLPAVSLNLNPVSFNRSLRVLQEPSDGSYSYVEDYSNNSSGGVSVNQKIGLSGGELNVTSNINLLNEFSRKRNRFSTTPFSIGYSQQLRGGGKQHRLEKEIEYAKNKVAIKQYCSNLSQIQYRSVNMFMTALLGKMEQELSLQNMYYNDTLLQLAHIKINNGYITEYELKQIELQSLNAQYEYENVNKSYLEALERLSVFLGMEHVEIAKPYFDVPLVIDMQTVLYYVKKNNPFFKQQEIQKMDAERNIFISKLSNRFNGSISLNYGVNQFSENFADAFRNVNTRQSLVIGFQIPVFQWGVNKNRLQIAENNYKASKLTIDKSMREFENEAKENVNRYNHSVKLWMTAEKAYILSQEQYKTLIQKFSYGKVSIYEISAAQNEQNNAMQRYYSAIRNTYDSYFSLRNMALYDFKQNVELEELLIND